MAHPYKHKAQGGQACAKSRYADGGAVGKDQSRYGDDSQGGLATPNQEGAYFLQDPIRTKNSPGYDTDTMSSRPKHIGASRLTKGDQ